jgi:hypothetical protein
MCCDDSGFMDVILLKKLTDKFSAETKNIHLAHCVSSVHAFRSILHYSFQKADEKYAQVLNLTEANGELNSTALKKHIDDRIKLEDWNKNLKQSFDTCTAFVTKSLDKIEKAWSAPPYNVNKGDCNIKTSEIIDCILETSYAVTISARRQQSCYSSLKTFLELSN